MKCPNCGYENKESAKYCIKCGTALQPAYNDEDVRVAFRYTANMSAARQIAASSQNQNDLRKKCIAWIREKDPHLFEDTPDPSQSPLLESIADWDTDLVPMDYEERIVVLMHVHDHMSLDQTADELHLSRDQVKAELQSAYGKVHKAEEQPTIPLPKQKTEPKKKKRFTAKKVRQIILLSLLGAVVVILGIFFGVRNYASGQYQKGAEALSGAQYEEAVEHFKNAIRFGYEEDAEKQLGNAYEKNNDLENALSSWRTYYDAHKDDMEVKASLISGYEKMADQKLDEGSPNDARELLNKEYEINPVDFVEIRIQAIDNSGLYRDEDNNEFNSYGQPLRLSNSRYALSFTYDSSHHLSQIVGSVGINSLNSVYSDFDFTNDETQYNIEWIKPENSRLTWRSDQIIYEDGSISEENISTETRTYTKSYHDESSYIDSEGNEITIETSTDENNRISSVQEKLGSDVIIERNYRYNDNDDTYSEMDVTIQDSPDSTLFGPSDYKAKTVSGDECHIYRQDITNEDDKTVGTAWYIPYNGTVTLYMNIE